MPSIDYTLGYEKSKADPFLYYKWDESHGILVWIILCDDLVLFGANEEVILKNAVRMFEVDDAGSLVDYLGCRLMIDWEK